MIMDSKNIDYTVIDITIPTNEQDKDFMLTNATEKGITVSDPNPRHPLPPQIFNGTTYCGDYNGFELANENDELEDFLHIEVKNGAKNGPVVPPPVVVEATNGKIEHEEPAVVQDAEPIAADPEPVVETTTAEVQEENNDNGDSVPQNDADASEEPTAEE